MTEIALRSDTSPVPVEPTGQARSLVEWAQEAQAAHELATPLCRTAFVPAAFQGKPADATAAILAGYEVGLSPLAALNAIDVIQGRPSFKAITIRALVLSAGHDMWLAESSPSRCVVRGQRRGSQQVQESVWTIERAREMGLTGKDQWKKQPQAMLVARATAECGRLVAPDVLLGVPYSSEEVADFERPPATVTAVQGAPVKRMRRATAPPPEVPEPEVEAVTDEPTVEDPITKAQLTKLHAALTGVGITDRDLALEFLTAKVGREITTSKDLTKPEASFVIDYLENEATPAEPTLAWPDVTQPADA